MYNNLKEKLLVSGLVYDNEFLDKYVLLIEQNRNTKYENNRTQRHHIIPVFYYKSNSMKVDNTIDNLVNLLYKDHLLAHYYLAMCAVDKYVYQAFVPLFIILDHKSFPKEEKILIENLPMIQSLYERSRKNSHNPMYNETIREQHRNKMRSKSVREAISKTMRQKIEEGNFFTEEHRKKLSSSARNRISINKEGKEKHIKPDELSYYISEGWVVGGLPSDPEVVERQARGKYKPVQCINEEGKIISTFESLKQACEWWVTNGYTRKIPKNIYCLADAIKLSSVKDKYICGIKWQYLDKNKNGGDVNE